MIEQGKSYINGRIIIKRGGVIDGSKSAHGRHFCPANVPAKKVPMGSAQQKQTATITTIIM
jgi:hypothetical protein